MRLFTVFLFFFFSFFKCYSQDSTALPVQASDSATAGILQQIAPVPRTIKTIVKYGIAIPIDTVAAAMRVKTMVDSVVMNNPMVAPKQTVYAIELPHSMEEHTTDFYLLIALCLLLGVIRTSDPKYFANLWRVFKSPSLSGRTLKDKLETATISNLLMNVFFTLTAGAYIYYLLPVFSGSLVKGLHPTVVLLILVGGMMLTYLGKYAVIKFSGWAFKVEGITDHYLFNVFLINKIISVILLPFIILLAFVGTELQQLVIIVSLILLGVLLINRYIRSWQVFSSFFQYSKFHFFTYLCASEILPLAVLMKLLVRGMYYF